MAAPVDARELGDGHVEKADVCIIGAGAAGITLARALASSSLQVVLLEAGGLRGDAATQDLYEGQVADSPIRPKKLKGYLRSSRLRFFGGSTNHWGGWCRPLDPIDFDKRDWIPHSGWPIAYSDVAKYYPQAAEIAGVTPFAQPEGEPDLPGRPLMPLSADGSFHTRLFHLSPSRRFGVHFGKQLSRAPRLRTLLWANAVELRLNSEGRALTSVLAKTLAGKSFEVQARAFVLATGGLENPRLLLGSRAVHPQGVGNQHDLVGRFFMEHLPVRNGLFVATDPGSMRLYTLLKDASQGHRSVGVAQASASLQRSEKLLNACYRIDKLQPYEKLKARDKHFVRWAHQALQGRAYRAGKERAHLAVLESSAEQSPNPESRVKLTAERDALGVPRIELHWRLSRLDYDSVRRTGLLLARAWGALGSGRVKLAMPEVADGAVPDWNRAKLLGGEKHHMGTTRMHDDPKQGVVDRHGRVHGVGNLFVAGSSVFPTAGFANPTLTLVALTLRLAEHLRETLS